MQSVDEFYFRIMKLHLSSIYVSGSKAFECTVCGKGLARKDKLTIHMRIHTGGYLIYYVVTTIVYLAHIDISFILTRTSSIIFKHKIPAEYSNNSLTVYTKTVLNIFLLYIHIYIFKSIYLLLSCIAVHKLMHYCTRQLSKYLLSTVVNLASPQVPSRDYYK